MMKINPAELLTEAKRAMAKAYAPYSRYKVGAALLAADGTIFHGCNVENASYGLTSCAERTAVCSAVATGRRAFRAIAIVASGKKLPSPCGACRQVLAEFCKPGMDIFFAPGGNLSKVKHRRLSELLPVPFCSR